MADQRTMAELLRVPTEGYVEAIVVPPILAEKFELKHSLIIMMTSDQFFGLEKDNPHDLIRCQSANKCCDYRYDSYIKQFQATPPPVSVKAVEEICVTCGGAHPYYQCLITDSNTFLEHRDNIHGYVAAAAVNYNHGNSGYRPLGMANQIRPPGSAQPNVQNNQNWFGQPQGYNRGNNFNPEQSYQSLTQQNQVVPLSSGSLPSNTIANPKGEFKAITTRSGIVLDRPSVPIPPSFINPEEDERVEETLTDQDLAEYTIKVPPPLLHINITPADALILILKYQKMLKALLSKKEKLQELANIPLNENYSAVILKKLPEKLGDPRKFLIPCGFSELKCKALADLGASINLMPLSVWKKLGLPKFISTRMTIELANRAICTPAGIARDVFVPVGKFTFSADFVIVDYESDPRVHIILGRPFLRTAHALIDVHGEEMILYDSDERLTLNMRHDTSSYSNQPQKESINLINVLNDSSKDFLENLSTNQPSGNPIFSSYPILTSPEVKYDIFDPEGGNVLTKKLLDLDFTKDLLPLIMSSNHKEIEYLLHHDPIKDIDSILEDLIDQSNLVDLNDNLVDTMPEMFTNEHALNYSFPPLYDEYDDDLFEVQSDTEYVYNDPFDSKGEKIKESKLFIDELDLSSDFLPSFEYDSFSSEDFFEVDALPSINNEDKDFDPPLNELPSFKEVPDAETPLSFTSENEGKVFKPRILTSKEVHFSLIAELSHQGYNVFKINQILKSPMKIFLFSCGENIHILNVPCNGYHKRDKIQAKPDKTEYKTESVEKSKVNPDKVKGNRKIKSKEIKFEGLKLPILQRYNTRGEVVFAKNRVEGAKLPSLQSYTPQGPMV
nr:reverse transcriptase domain-containing protein [Tanacetum cinerariifolium]